ncbi:MAG: glycine cleavage system protein T [Dehalococcoidia bacterium]|nr:glycine cleavage system protein T [Dehalococcoidia bacterium]
MDAADAALRRTALYDTHVAAGARIVPFAGFAMPVQYPTGVLAEHHVVRRKVGLFDIGHMGQFWFAGRGALDLLQWVTTHDVTRLDVGTAQYSLLCLPSGGVVDDIIVYRLEEDGYFVVVNAANADRDWDWIAEQAQASERPAAPGPVESQRLIPERTLIALQGPRSRSLALAVCEPDPTPLRNYRAMRGAVAGVDAIIARTGYTGEYGFEFSIPAATATTVWQAILDAGEAAGLASCGLGARDTLRLEAGMALYGHELTEDTTPLEAGLDRVVRFEKGPFVGRSALEEQAAAGAQRRLVGLALTGRGVPREECAILHDGQRVGQLTSGGHSPTLKQGIGMGYVPTTLATPGTELDIEIRGRPFPAQVVPLPFYRRPRRRRKLTA